MRLSKDSRKTSACFGKKQRKSTRESLRNLDLQADTADEFNGLRGSSSFKKIKDKKSVLEYLRKPKNEKLEMEEGYISQPQSSKRLSLSRTQKKETFNYEDTRNFQQHSIS